MSLKSLKVLFKISFRIEICFACAIFDLWFSKNVVNRVKLDF
jgi:hypothetical protein